MPTLPYSHDALAPVISPETMEYHYGKHLQTYVNNLNKLIAGTEFDGKSVEEIVVSAPDGAIFNNAGQVLNHTLYFMQFIPTPARKEPDGQLKQAIERNFGSFEKFKEEFTAAATTLFGSGWAWLAADKDGKLLITKESNASNPLRNGLTPLLCIDVWEHAYYIDYRNARANHIAALWDIINWETIESRLK